MKTQIIRRIKCRKCHKILGYATGNKIGKGYFNVFDGTIQIGSRDGQLVSYCSKRCSKVHKTNWIALEEFFTKNEIKSYLWKKLSQKIRKE